MLVSFNVGKGGNEMTAEEIDIIVEANVEKALKEFQKLLPAIKKQLSGIQKEFEKVNIKDITANIDMSQVTKKVKQAKKQIKEAFNPEDINSKDMKKEINSILDEVSAFKEKQDISKILGGIPVKKIQQAKKQIKEAFDPNDISGMTIDGKAFNIKNITGYSKEVQKLKGQMGTLNKFKPQTPQVEVPKGEKVQTPKIQTPKTENTGQANQYSIWTNILRKYYAMLDMAKAKMTQLKQQTEQTGTSQGKLASFFGGFKGKLEQATPMVQSMKSVFNKMPNVTKLVSDNVKKMGTNFKTGLKHVLKYAGALFGLQGIYNVLSGSAQSWLSSQNAGAQQLSANIEYMKYAMGSAFAPVIEYVISLIYQLMKAIQSVVYAFSGVNIFAKATASSMGKTAKSAKETNKSLAGVHGEINNVSEKDNNGGGGAISPNMDLSQMENTPSSIVEAIKNGNWYEVGAIIGEKLNEAMVSIPWDKIQSGARNIAIGISNGINGFVTNLDWNLLGITIGNGINTAFIFANTFLTTINWGSIGNSIANFLNSAILTTDWNLLGTTFANKLNAIIHFAYNFITTFDWGQFGKVIGDSINGFFTNIDWATAGQALGEGIKGIFEGISAFLNEVDWEAIGEGVKTFIQNIDWVGIWEAVKETIKSAIGSVDGILTGLFGEGTATIIEAIALAIGAVTLATTLYSIAKSKETAILLANAAAWIAANLPIILITAAIAALIAIIILIVKHWEEVSAALSAGWEWIKQKAEEIFTAIGEFFKNIWQGICDTVTTIWNNICNFFKGIWDWIVQTVTNTFNNIKQFISDVLNGIATIWNNIWNWISNFVSGIWNGIVSIISNVINGIKNTISNVLNTVKTIWNNIWTGIKNTVVNIWNGIWGCIKGVINAIL